MTRIKVMALLLVTVISLSACGNQDNNQGNSPDKAETVTEASDTAESKPSADAGEGEAIAPIPLYQGTQESCLIQEDDQYLYFCGSYQVSKIDKITGEEVILWENAEEVTAQEEYLYSRGTGLLLGDRIYFIEIRFDGEDNMQRALSTVCTDGTGYERLTELKYRSSDIMLLQNGTLYVDDMDREVWFRVYEDGLLSGPDEQEKDYFKQIFYADNGERLLFQQQALEEFGCYMEKTDDGYIYSINPDTGEQVYIPELVFFEGYNSQYILCAEYEEGMSLKLVKRDGLAEKEIFSREEFFDILGLDEKYVYIMLSLYEGNKTTYSYEKISLEDGAREVIFTREASELLKYDSAWLIDVIIQNGYIYYVDVQDYSFYRMRRKLDNPDTVEIVGNPIYETGIGLVGELDSFYEQRCDENNPENVLYTTDLTWLVVDDKFPGSNLINSYVIAHQESNMSYAWEQVEWMIEDQIETVIGSELRSDFSGFTYFDNHYISFIQQEYEYQAGAAHGMPWWIGFTFDLETGERLLIEDIVYNSEAELKEIVTRYFEEMINSQPEGYYWEDAVEVVRENTDVESDFYLTEEGIVFYYGPYDLACYAAGFQEVTIPYEEFDLRIILEKRLP